MVQLQGCGAAQEDLETPDVFLTRLLRQLFPLRGLLSVWRGIVSDAPAELFPSGWSWKQLRSGLQASAKMCSFQMHLTFFKHNSIALRIGHLCLGKARQMRGPQSAVLGSLLTLQGMAGNQPLMFDKRVQVELPRFFPSQQCGDQGLDSNTGGRDTGGGA